MCLASTFSRKEKAFYTTWLESFWSLKPVDSKIVEVASHAAK
jgi:hypothetical protein